MDTLECMLIHSAHGTLFVFDDEHEDLVRGVSTVYLANDRLLTSQFTVGLSDPVDRDLVANAVALWFTTRSRVRCDDDGLAFEPLSKPERMPS